ncbi:MAG: NAD(P)H:quinone oxidoreductase, partial [Alphaproteobacteria bacterium]|nr:NAD(P)H:quinone oxidoreductase [Alphaproteobacteria bacterium]
MTKVLVLYYSSYGHIHEMAKAVAEGAASIPGVEVDVKRVPETVPEEVRKQSGFRDDFDTDIAQVSDLPNYDAIIIGTPTRFGNMAGQMKQFIDQCGGLWFENKLVGKVGAVFTSTGSQHGGHEASVLSTQVPFYHFGMVVVGMPYTYADQMNMDQIIGGSP